MTYSVSSAFVDSSLEKTNSPEREFTIGSSDYSSKVLKWPTLSKEWDSPKPVTVTMDLTNADLGMNFLRVDKTLLTSTCAIKMGYNAELITVHSGLIDLVKYAKGKCTLRIIDKMKQLGERLVGDRTTPVTYTDELLSDVAWWLVTSYGGYDVTTSTANTDIDWTQFAEWSSIMSGDSINVSANFEGIKVTECLRKISRMSRSAIYIENDKLVFSRFSVLGSPDINITDETMIDSTLTIKDADIVNRQLVNADYDVTSKVFNITVFDVISSSINSYGIRESVEEDKSIWYVNSISALNLAQRITFVNGEPQDRVTVTTPLTTLTKQIGDTIGYANDQQQVDDNYRIMRRSLNVDKGRITLNIDRSQLVNPFILDVTSLDGTEVLT